MTYDVEVELINRVKRLEGALAKAIVWMEDAVDGAASKAEVDEVAAELRALVPNMGGRKDSREEGSE
jgi:hypothetical protein